LFSVLYHSAAQSHQYNVKLLIANGLLNGYWVLSIFDPPPTESMSLNWLPKKLSQVITSTNSTAMQNVVEIRHGGFWANRWNITQNTLFSGTHLQVRTLNRFSCWMTQITQTHAGVCFFGFRWYCSPFSGSDSPKTQFLRSFISCNLFQMDDLSLQISLRGPSAVAELLVLSYLRMFKDIVSFYSSWKLWKRPWSMVRTWWHCCNDAMLEPTHIFCGTGSLFQPSKNVSSTLWITRTSHMCIWHNLTKH